MPYGPSAQDAARAVKNPPSAFSSVPLRKPVVGLPPASQAFSAGVAKPSPKVLSTKAHRKVQPRAIRAMAHT